MREQSRRHQSRVKKAVADTLDRETAQRRGYVALTQSFDLRRWDRGGEAMDMLEELRRTAPARQPHFVNVGRSVHGVRRVEIWALPAGTLGRAGGQGALPQPPHQNANSNPSVWS